MPSFPPHDDNPPPPNSITALYQALVGPLNQPYYLGRFTRFDDIGRSFPTWNWAAALLTLNWLLFRGLWGAALAYAGAVAAAVLAVFGLGKLVLGFTDDAIHALLGVGLAVAFVVPGMYGDAWYHRRSKRQMADAILSTDDNAQAASKLAGQAPSPRRLGLLALGNALVLAPVVALFGLSWQLPGADKLAGLSKPPAPMAAAATSAAVRPLATASSAPPGASAPPATSPAAVSATSAASSAVGAPTPPAAAASRGDSGSIAQGHEPANMAAAAHPAASMPVLAPPPAAKASVPASAPTTAVSATATPKPAAPASAPASRANTPAVAAPRAGPSAAGAIPAAASSPKMPAPAAASAPTPTPASKPRPTAAAAKPAAQFFVDAGIYAQTGNAKRAIDSLREAKLPVVAEELDMVRGVRTRVRVGPFTSRAQAAQAARQVKALGLPALVDPPR